MVTPILLPRTLPGEKRQRSRWCPCWWYQEWLGRRFLFLAAQVRQNPIDDVLVLNTSDDPDGAPTPPADLYLDIEDAFQALSPGHSGMTLNG